MDGHSYDYNIQLNRYENDGGVIDIYHHWMKNIFEMMKYSFFD